MFNQDLIRSIEAAGGEVVTTPYSEYLRLISSAYFRRWWKDGELSRLVVFKTMLGIVDVVERYLRRYIPAEAARWFPASNPNVESDLERFHVSLFNEGESYDNILKICHLLREHPDLALLVQASPAFCCPSVVTEAMKSEIEAVTGVPMISITYDGTGTVQNDVIVPYLQSHRAPVASR